MHLFKQVSQIWNIKEEFLKIIIMQPHLVHPINPFQRRKKKLSNKNALASEFIYYCSCRYFNKKNLRYQITLFFRKGAWRLRGLRVTILLDYPFMGLDSVSQKMDNFIEGP
jgi:hypothetical protein